jgi:hypothetical protein
VPGWVKARTDDEDSESEEDLLITETFDTADSGEEDLEPFSDEENFVLNEAADDDITNEIPLIPAVAEKTDKVI